MTCNRNTLLFQSETMAAAPNWFSIAFGTGDLKEIVPGRGMTEEQMEIALKSKKFRDFITTFDHTKLSLTKITIMSVFLFGPNLGFALLNCDIKTRAGGKPIPGVVFLRGDAVAILVIAACEGKRYALLTMQYRAPVGCAIVEAVAGMMDEGKDPFGVAIKEVNEETGIIIKRTDLTFITKMSPSAGGCDEQIDCFYTRPLEMSPDALKKIQSHIFGSGDEIIRIIAAPFNNLKEAVDLHQFGDSKINSCVLGMIASGYFN